MMARPQFEAGGNSTCYDALENVDAAMQASILPEHNYFLVGGVPSGAYMQLSTGYENDDRRVLAQPDSAISLFRPNGTRRDLDFLVKAKLSAADCQRINQNLREAVDDKLVVSVFGLDSYEPTMTRRERLAKAAGSWLSSRTIDDAGVLRYELFPLARTFDPASLEPWKLVLPKGGTVDILHPAGHVLAYTMRSISGLRHKDESKLRVMAQAVLPGFEGEVRDGIFRDWSEFAADISLLRTSAYIMPSGLRPDATRNDIRLAKFKSRLLHWVESQDMIVDIAQRDLMQKALNSFIHAK